jgi:tetratricopeptide (TPR) repeat protein
MMKKLAALVLFAQVAAAAPKAPPTQFSDLMARGKLEADLGNRQAAMQTFLSLTEDREAPVPLRWEALVRLGTVRRQAGDHEGSVQAFQQAFASYKDDPEAIRFLTLTVAGVVPDAERWKAIWKDVGLLVKKDSKGEPRAEIVWPGPSHGKSGASYSGDRITLDLLDAKIADVLKNFANLTGLNIALDPEEHGLVTAHLVDVPWDEALERILESQGLGYFLEGAQMKVARPEKLAAATTRR